MFDSAYQKLLLIEGAYTDNPNDSGGETYAGISRRAHPRWPGWTLLEEWKQSPGFPANIDHEQLEPMVRELYRKEYWDSNRLDDIAQVSEPIAHELFDTCVNTGIRGQFLQRALNALNRKQRDYPDIHVDGVIGPATLAALRSFLQIRGHDGERVLLASLNAQLHQHYLELVEARQKDEEFFYGWVLHRVVH